MANVKRQPVVRNPDSPFQLSFYTLLSVIAAVWAGLAAGIFVINAFIRAFYPYLTNLGEAALAQSIQNVQQGVWPYHELSHPPFSVVPYGPVYLVLSAAVQFFFKLPMTGGRLVCLAATNVAAFCIGYLIFRGDRRMPTYVAAIGSGAFFMSLPYVTRWGAQVNVDMTALALELVALSCFFLYAVNGHRIKKHLWFGIAAAVAAVFTKSSAIAAMLAWGSYLLVSKRWKDLLLFCVVAGSAIAGIYLVLNTLTHGQYYFHTIHEIGHRLFFKQFIRDFWLDLCRQQPVNVIAAALALLSPFLWTGLEGRQALLNLYLVFTVLLTVSLGKQGSDTNYLLPFMAASTLAVGRVWSWFSWGGKQFLGILLIMGITAQSIFTSGLVDFSIQKARAQKAEQKLFYDKLSAFISKFPDPIISWDMSLLIANHRPIYFEPFPMAQAAYSGVWDQTPILNDLRSRKIKLIITYFWYQAIKADRNFTPEFITAMRDNYNLSGQIKIPWAQNQYLFFYVPKPS